MNPKIIVSPELAKRIADCKAWMAEQTDATASRQAQLQADIEGLEKSARELAVEALQLEAQIVGSTEAAEKFNAVTSRRDAISGRLALLQRELDDVTPPSLVRVSSVLNEIIAVWHEELPKIISQHLAPFVVDDNRASQIGKMFDCWGQLRVLRGFEYQANARLTPGNIAQLNRIFDRAMAGQCLLYTDPRSADELGS